MKKSILTILALMPILTFAQKETEYKATNNVIYKIGDTIKLGMGSAINGDFLYLQMAGWAGAMNGGSSDANNIGKKYANTNVIIKKIKSSKVRGAKKYRFIVGGGNITNYELLIEEAISSNEIRSDQSDIKSVNIDNLDQIEKLKKLFDSGAITQDEFNSKKKKLLGL